MKMRNSRYQVWTVMTVVLASLLSTALVSQGL
jgi:hypothetical protein